VDVRYRRPTFAVTAELQPDGYPPGNHTGLYVNERVDELMQEAAMSSTRSRAL
jgi:hypothetical protein